MLTMVPASPKREHIDARHLGRALDLAKAAGDSDSVSIERRGGRLSLIVRSITGSKQPVRVALGPASDGPDVKKAVSIQYLQDALRGHNGVIRMDMGEVDASGQPAEKPALSPLMVEHQSGARHIIMPLRFDDDHGEAMDADVYAKGGGQ